MPISINDAQRTEAAERVEANQGFSSAEPPHAPKGLSTPLHPGGTRPGGVQNADEPTGSLKGAER
jgi:hypothetical protein